MNDAIDLIMVFMNIMFDHGFYEYHVDLKAN